MSVLDYSAEEYVGSTLQTADTFGATRETTHLSCDALIVGAGPSGIISAMLLAEAGLDVIIVEGGRFWPRYSFTRKQSWAAKNLMQEQGTRVMSGNAFIPVASGRGVGGGTLVNSAICFRAPDRVLDEWVNEWGLDYFSEANREALYSEVEAGIGVAPTPAAIAGENSLIAQRGFRKLGFSAGFMPRNAPGCVGCGTCQTGCPTGGKASADITWLPRFLRAGGRLFADTRAEEIKLTGDRATGINAVLYNPENKQAQAEFSIDADRVILAAGAINTSMILQRQDLANRSGEVGKNLRVHPGCAVIARFEEEVRIWSGATQGYYAYHPEDQEILLETFSASPDVFLAQTAVVGEDDPGEFLRDVKHIAGCGVMIRDSSSGRVKPGKNHTARISYNVNREDLKKFTTGIRTISEMFFEAGSRAVMPMVANARFFSSRNMALDHIRIKNSPSDLSLYSSHPMGTCRIGEDPTRSVVRPTDGRTHDVEQLYVVDSSLFPTALGANPQISIMAQAMALTRGMLNS